MASLNTSVKILAEVIEYNDAKRRTIHMAAKAPAGGKKPKKRKRKMRLSLKQKKIHVTGDSYKDNLGWSTEVGRTIGDAPAQKAPETLRVQCDSCGSMLKIPKPKKARYTVTCSYPECGNQMKFE
jgi:rRNA maturation protein Nop10|tara:strand:+ start:72 stop:446 length:375 start_codon:yes stop_codon:yes gene_type:complete